MTRTGYFVRLAFSIVIDLFDFTLGRIPGLGIGNDFVTTIVLVAMWGPTGLLNLWELADITEQIDGFVPTATIVALFVGLREGHLTGKPRAAAPTTSREIASQE